MALSKEELDALATSLDGEKKLKKDYLDFLASDAVLPEPEAKPLETKPKTLPGTTISAPKGNTFLTRNAQITLGNGRTVISPEEQAAKQRERFKSILPKVLREGLFGSDKKVKPTEPTFEQNFRQSVAQGMRQYSADEGLAGFLAPEMTKPKETRMFDIIDGLSSRGIDSDRAEQIALREVFGEGDVSMTGEEKVKLGNLKTERNAMLVLDALDLFPAWKALKSGSKVALEQTLKEASEQTTRKGMRDVIERDFIRFKGTSNVDDIVDVIEKTKVLNDSKKLNEIEKAISEANNSLEIRKEILTRAQRVEYDNGVPVVRIAPNTVSSTVRLRKYITDTLQSMREEYRLSNPDIFAKEMRAGSIVKDTTPDGTIDVFSLGSGLGKIGENVTVSKTLAEAKGITPKVITVNVDDLVRLPDGTFTIAPKSALAPDATPAIQGVRREIQGSVAATEKAAKQKLYKEKLARESLEKSKRLADEQEATRLAKEDANRIARETARKVDAEKTIKETPIAVAKRKADIDVEVASDIAKIEAKANVAKAELKSAVDSLKTLGKGVKTAEKKVITVQKAIAKAKKQGRATARLKQALAKAKTEFVAAKKAERMAQTVAKKAKANIPTDTKVKVAELKAKADVRKAQIVEESKKAVAEARAIIKEITTANKVPSTRNIERLQAKVDKLEGKKAKLIEAYGGIDEVPAEKIEAIDDAIEALGEAGDTTTKRKLYHGGSKIEEIDLTKSNFQKTFYMSDNPDYAKSYGGSKSVLNEIELSPKAKLADMRNPSQELVEEIKKELLGKGTGKIIKIPKPDGSYIEVPELKGGASNPVYSNSQIIKGIEDGKAMFAELPEVKEILRKLGYDGQITTESEFGSNYGVWNKDVVAVARSKNATKVTEEVATAKIKPVKIEGTDVKTSVLAERLSAGLKGMEDSPEFNVATHAKQTESALDHISKHGIDDTLSMIEKGSFPTNTTKASMVSSLMEAISAVTDDALKLNYTNRLAAYIPELSEFATRAGQEIEALKVLHKDNPVMKIMRIQRLLNSDKNVERAAAEVAKLEKQLSKVDTKSIIKEAIDKSTCLK